MDARSRVGTRRVRGLPWLGLAGALLLAPTVAEPADPPPDLSGLWKIDPEASDDARQKLRDAMESQRERGGGGPRGGGMRGGGMRGDGRGPGGGPGGGRGGQGPGRGEAAPRNYDTLTIRQSDDEIQIEYGEDVQIYRPDGRKVDRVTEFGAFELRAKWKGDELVIDREAATGRKTREELSLQGDKLVLVQTLEGRRT